MNNFNNLKDFETLFFKKIRGLSENDEAIKERIKKSKIRIFNKNFNF